MIYNLWKDGLLMGYLEYVFIYIFLCVLVVFMGLKFLNFVVVNCKSGILMIVVYMIFIYVV